MAASRRRRGRAGLVDTRRRPRDSAAAQQELTPKATSAAIPQQGLVVRGGRDRHGGHRGSGGLLRAEGARPAAADRRQRGEQPGHRGGLGKRHVSVVLPADARPATPPPLTCGSILDWAHGNGGVDQEATRVRLVVQGASDKGVLIDGMRARPIRRTATPDPGGISLACGGPQGVATPRRIAMDLDRAEPSAEYATKVDGRLPSDFPAEGETQVGLTATTKGTVSGNGVGLVVDGGGASVEVTNHGQSSAPPASSARAGYRSWPGRTIGSSRNSTPLRRRKPVSPADFRYS